MLTQAQQLNAINCFDIIQLSLYGCETEPRLETIIQTHKPIHIVPQISSPCTIYATLPSFTFWGLFCARKALRKATRDGIKLMFNASCHAHSVTEIRNAHAQKSVGSQKYQYV